MRAICALIVFVTLGCDDDPPPADGGDAAVVVDAMTDVQLTDGGTDAMPDTSTDALPVDAGRPDESCPSDPVDAVTSDDGMPSIEPTFHSAGIYWKPATGDASVACSVRVRRRGECDWRDAQNLFFDDHDHTERDGPAARVDEYRGSLIDLIPDTAYEVRLTLESGEVASLPFRTWSESFPVARTVVVEDSSETLVIDEGGDADGYVLYVAADDGGTIDVGSSEENGVEVNASWVIVRGLSVRGGSSHGIRLGAVNHVVIEDCDVSGWGSEVTSGMYAGFGRNLQSAVFSSEESLSHVVLQRNWLHHPETDSNSWDEFGDFDHPEGPQGVVFRDSAGHHVIRYNRIESDDDHKFNDGMGHTRNFSYGGFPGPDSDIYANHITHCWDDAIETEGINQNVRVFGNYVDLTFIAFGAAGNSVGPFYLFRNVSGRSERGAPEHGTDSRIGNFVKLGGVSDSYTSGAMFIFHNTMPLYPHRFRSGRQTGNSGIHPSASDRHQHHVWTRNNVLLREDTDRSVISNPLDDPTNDYDYDVTNARFSVEQPNGIEGADVQFDPDRDPLEWPLADGSPGHDDAANLPGFNAAEGEAPDRGAFERGAPSAGYGIDADWTRWASWVWSR